MADEEACGTAKKAGADSDGVTRKDRVRDSATVSGSVPAAAAEAVGEEGLEGEKGRLTQQR